MNAVDFEQFLIRDYQLEESSAKDYVGRLNGIFKKGLYNGENEITPGIENAIEEEYPISNNDYKLALKRYMAFRNKMMNESGFSDNYLISKWDWTIYNLVLIVCAWEDYTWVAMGGRQFSSLWH